MKYAKIEKIAKGWSSYIWKVKALSNNSEDSAQFPPGWTGVLKEVREKSNRKNLAEREGKMLSLANTIGIGPKVEDIDFEKNFVVMEFVEGPKLLDWVLSEEFDLVSRKEAYAFVKELVRQCLALDEIGLRHTQLQVGKNILVTKRKGKLFPVIIDFEKASVNITNKKLKNFGQITAFLFLNPNGAVAKRIREKLNLKL
jgi:putative serine/threonine protein kinase